MSALLCSGMKWATILCMGMMWATMLCRGMVWAITLGRGMKWVTMLGRNSDLLSITWWLRGEESWPELMVDWAEWEIKLMFWKTSKDSALWVSNDSAEGLDGAMMARVEGGMERLVVDVL